MRSTNSSSNREHLAQQKQISDLRRSQESLQRVLKTSRVSPAGMPTNAIGTYNANNSIVQANQAQCKAARNVAIV